MIAVSRDSAWIDRLRAVAARAGWSFAEASIASVSKVKREDHVFIVLDRGAAEGPLPRAVASLRARFPQTWIAVSFSEDELGADGVAAGLACGADEVLVKSWPDARLKDRLSAARDAGLAAAVRVSADRRLKAELRSRRVAFLERGRWSELEVPAAEFALLWLLLSEEGADVSRERLLAALRQSAGREVEVETVSRRVLSLRRSLARWKGGVETVRGGFYRLVSSRRRSRT
ncbi:MAG: winged helix-turn-helix domain-containing protein [Elusimicrobiota bacterium]